MWWWLKGGLMLGALAAGAIFIFGPAVIGAFDALCFFATAAQCTSVQWNHWRVVWAIFPVAFLFFGFMLSTL